jgi:3-deoxy-D-manno-octulosonic acid kinase
MRSSEEPSHERFVATPRGGILYDAARLRQPDDRLFSREHWAANLGLREASGGRGSIAFLSDGDRRWVLRNYRRGGWIAKLSRDRYFWLGRDKTRAFTEWRLLAELRKRGLPVPAPVAARYERGILTYAADLITEQLPTTKTLADAISGASLSQEQWRGVGATVAEFHRHGVHHADLNAHNILLEEASSRVYVLDFDRGRIRPRGAWEDEVLQRLKRSLEKIRRQRADVRFQESDWQALMDGYVAGERRP